MHANRPKPTLECYPSGRPNRDGQLNSYLKSIRSNRHQADYEAIFLLLETG